MAGNTFGKILRLTTFGESHGPAIGGVLDGCIPGLPISESDIQQELDKRKPGGGSTSTKRRESDKIEIISGIFEGVSTGTPIAFIIRNEDHRSQDYSSIADVFRPGHADWTYFKKFNGIRDYRGGGRASGRETACRVAGGVIAQKILQKVCNATITAGCVEFGGIPINEDVIDVSGAGNRPYFAAADYIIPYWEAAIKKNKANGDTLGGIVRIVANNIPPGLGEPVFLKLDAMLAFALLSVGAVKGLEFGSGFNGAKSSGSQNNDQIFPAKSSDNTSFNIPDFTSNNAGGILGGISSGQPIIIQVAIKPIASIAQEQNTINRNGEAVRISIGGRHDLSAIPRIIPVLTAMTALTLADALLLQTRMDLSL